jgi:hypothetical protein
VGNGDGRPRYTERVSDDETVRATMLPHESFDRFNRRPGAILIRAWKRKGHPIWVGLLTTPATPEQSEVSKHERREHGRLRDRRR